MSKGKSKANARRNSRKLAEQSRSKATQQERQDTNKANEAKGISADVSKPSAASSRRFKVKSLFAVVTLLCVVTSTIVGYRLLKPTQEQANEAKQGNDRQAGRLVARTEIVEIIPTLKSAEMKPIVKPLHPGIVDDRGQPADFVTFDDIHAFCSVNPRIRLKNTGNEIIESVQIHVEETSVMPIGPNGPYFVRDAHDQKKTPVAYKPRLDPTQTETCVFAEKFKPGDEADVPIWRPLLKAIQGAHVLMECRDRPFAQGPGGFGKDKLLFPGWNGKYQGTFMVYLCVKAVGESSPDRTEKGPVPLGFVWSAQGFQDEDCKKILGRQMAALKVR
jgi:hypothetical protein